MTRCNNINPVIFLEINLQILFLMEIVMKTQDVWSKIRTPKRWRKCIECPPKEKCRNRLGCCKKDRFPNKSMAESAEFSYRNDISLSTMDHYPCKFHKGSWHLGHDEFMTEREILHRDLLHYKSMLQYDDENHEPEIKNNSLMKKWF